MRAPGGALLVRGDALHLPLADGKTCTACRQIKPLTDFYRDGKRPDGRRARCRVCVREYANKPAAVENRKRYRSSERWREVKREFRQRHLERIRAEDQARRHATQLRVDALKMERGCVDCGYRVHPAALDFDHRDPSTKTAEISKLLGRHWSKVLDEIAKCDVRCANCHRIATVEAQRKKAKHRRPTA